jgi:hypothetical protein
MEEHRKSRKELLPASSPFGHEANLRKLCQSDTRKSICQDFNVKYFSVADGRFVLVVYFDLIPLYAWRGGGVVELGSRLHTE